MRSKKRDLSDKLRFCFMRDQFDVYIIQQKYAGEIVYFAIHKKYSQHSRLLLNIAYNNSVFLNIFSLFDANYSKPIK